MSRLSFVSSFPHGSSVAPVCMLPLRKPIFAGLVSPGGQPVDHLWLLRHFPWEFHLPFPAV